MGLEQLITKTISKVNGIFVDAQYSDGQTTETVRASIEHDVEFIGEYMQSMDKRTEITLLASQVPQPRRNDVITWPDGTAWTVEGPVDDDGEFITVSVTK